MSSKVFFYHVHIAHPVLVVNVNASDERMDTQWGDSVADKRSFC